MLNGVSRSPHSTFNIQHLTFNIPRLLVSSVSQRFGHDLGVLRRYAKERLRGTVGRMPAVLPRLERGDADADHERELRLRLAELVTDLAHLIGADGRTL